MENIKGLGLIINDGDEVVSAREFDSRKGDRQLVPPAAMLLLCYAQSDFTGEYRWMMLSKIKKSDDPVRTYFEEIKRKVVEQCVARVTIDCLTSTWPRRTVRKAVRYWREAVRLWRKSVQ